MKNPLDKTEYLKRTLTKEHPIRGEFFRDQTAIIHSMPFRRLKHKTQVFFSPENDHVCTRIEHVMHVATIGATICKGLNNHGWNLNIEMAFAIGLGHDLGHAPFGHAGETALNKKLNSDFNFIHEVNSYRVIQYLANYGKGLNLTYGVKDGIINHNGEKFSQYLEPFSELNDLDEIKDRKSLASSYEGIIVRFSDSIAYLGRDIEDAMVAKFITLSDVPEEIRENVGKSNGDIINSLIIDLINNSKDSSKIGFSDEMYEKLNILKKFNYKYIYAHPTIMKYRKKGEAILEELFDYLLNLYDNFGQDYEKYNSENSDLSKMFGNYLFKMKDLYNQENNIPKQIVTDYIAGMTDNFALESYKSIKLPKPIKF
ncbi:HD domain-containing protein [uncultured Draconibacterium sp.]|uniref:deoxyguanosinetriphosphate triphosphohydrolase family protein n=1 Tax=uncultured Draconibacterium sp. TaxID=1573823 RepID=UPI0029C83C6B|nr:HD domain-containing protein [uncultured Draconibacterium sp.]